ncbi:DUF6457 domain-containing protein [Gulosibacter bifidus]|uniref:DUF6457 domain-containing protein n=1 Tax=Gulosibacter bifidus TaxID=272239 RepID=A0ABW5RHS4_9MICO|nr:DUF6457 domain-containing protein [Gulosibacter bifidus]
MSDSDNRTLPEGLPEWVAQISPALGLRADEVPTADLLSLTGVVAHGVVRPAAPITSFIMGLVLGRGTVSSYAEADAIVREFVETHEDVNG